MIKTTPVAIQLMGKPYTIKCPENEAENLQRAADKLNQQIEITRKQFGQLDEFETLLLASMGISHELVSQNKQQEKQNQQLTQLINSLENKISQATEDTNA